MSHQVSTLDFNVWINNDMMLFEINVEFLISQHVEYTLTRYEQAEWKWIGYRVTTAQMRVDTYECFLSDIRCFTCTGRHAQCIHVDMPA
jgi:hypothetical protein